MCCLEWGSRIDSCQVLMEAASRLESLKKADIPTLAFGEQLQPLGSKTQSTLPWKPAGTIGAEIIT